MSPGSPFVPRDRSRASRTSLRAAAVVPTNTIRPSRTATASATVSRGSTVMTVPFNKTMSAGTTCTTAGRISSAVGRVFRPGKSAPKTMTPGRMTWRIVSSRTDRLRGIEPGVDGNRGDAPARPSHARVGARRRRSDRWRHGEEAFSFASRRAMARACLHRSPAPRRNQSPSGAEARSPARYLRHDAVRRGRS